MTEQLREGALSSHICLLAVMRQVLRCAEIAEVPAAGEFTLPGVSPILFPGAVYGFAVRLTEEQARDLFEEAKERGLNRLPKLEDFRPIEGDLYPLYWGKDKQLGARPHQHLQDPTKTGSVRLSTYKSLAHRKIACVSLTVDDFEAAERALQTAFPDLLKTTTSSFGRSAAQ